MAYRLHYSDYPGTALGPPDPARWIGPPGPPGPAGPPGLDGTQGLTHVVVADAAPVGAPDSTLWWDSSGTGLYVRYNDGSSTQWVVAENQVPMPQGGLVNVLDHGAKGDGTTDDTAAIQAVLNTYAGKATVFVPDTGHAYMVGTINVPTGTDLLVHGTIMSKANSGTLFQVWTVSNVTVRGHGILDGNGANQTAGGVLYIYQANNAQVSGITMQNAKNWNLNVVASSYVRVTNCKMLHGSSANEFAQGCDDCWITNCTMDGPTIDFAFAFYGGVTNSGAIGNIARNSSAGIYIFSDVGQPAPCNNITVSDNVVYNNYGGGILVANSSGVVHNNIIIANNRCYGNNTGGGADTPEIFVNSTNSVLITGNLVSSGEGSLAACAYGIRVDGAATDVVVTGNSAYNIGSSARAGSGFNFRSPTGLLVTGNSVYDYRSPQYMTSAISGTAGIANSFVGNLSVSFPITITLNIDTVAANSVAGFWMVGTGTGTTSGAGVGINAAVAHNATVTYFSNSHARWAVGTDAAVESGSNTGAGYAVYAYNDDGSIVQALGINRATKLLSITVPPPFANDAAAGTGGIPVGGLYRTGSALQVRVI